ncbi:MAG: S41 family peptidase [Thermoanaerobaculia bacterium]
MKQAVLVPMLILALAPVGAAAQDFPTLDAEKRAAIVDRVAEALQEVYVFPEVAQKMSDHIHRQLNDGAYDEVVLVPAFTEQLTKDLQSISHDLHLRVRPIPPRDLTAEQTVDEDDRRRRRLADARARNFGFEKLEILAGNVGYLDLRGFSPAEYGGQTAIAAMNFLANADALIIDLRRNGGGSPSMIQLISSYFFDEPVHLNSFYIRREDKMDQFWTQAHVIGPRMTETPIWVLTSGRTFSAAEEFTYNLKNLERATIVGETTGGGAHPVDGHTFPELGIQMSLPFGRAVNPITGTNWEGTGVEPHISVSTNEALQVAHREALTALRAKADDSDRQFAISWALEGLEVEIEPVHSDPSRLADYVGVVGPRRVRLEDGDLLYQRDGAPEHRLIPMGDERFALDGYDRARVRFERDASGKVTTLVVLYDNGHQEPNPRSEE